jgi:3-oxoacyl-[acyl-carrier protein] reductase
MLMSVVDELRLGAVYPELAGARVLITGLSTACGIDIARAFADHRARLVVRAAEDTPEIDEIAALLNQSAADLKLYTDPDAADARAAVTFTQGAAQKAFGGLDVVVNIIPVTSEDFAGCADFGEIEDAIASKLSASVRMTRVLANRMRLTMTEGSILNVVATPATSDPATKMLVGMLRATAAALTREEARQWAGDAIRINSVVPKMVDPFCDDDDEMSAMGEPDVAALALYLASRKGRRHSGHIFEATQVARQGR